MNELSSFGKLLLEVLDNLKRKDYNLESYTARLLIAKELQEKTKDKVCVQVRDFDE